MKPEDYKGPASHQYKHPIAHGYATIELLEFLKGEKWNEVALAYVHALRPSWLRVIDEGGEEKSDARSWRVTVRVNEDNIIMSVWQEVEVGLPEGVIHGAALELRLAKG